MFEESGSNSELQLYTKWLHQVAPGAAPTYFGMFAWSSAELFTRLANQIGPNLTRPAMVKALAGVHNYTGNGLFAPQDVGGKTTSPCALFMQYTGSALETGRPPAPAGVAGSSSTPASTENGAVGMNVFLTYTVLGLVIGASYAIAASGLVLTYATTRIFNVAHGATAMVMAFVYWELAYNQGLSDWLSVLHRGVRGGAAVRGAAGALGHPARRGLRGRRHAGGDVRGAGRADRRRGEDLAAGRAPGEAVLRRARRRHRHGADQRERTADRGAGGGRSGPCCGRS